MAAKHTPGPWAFDADSGRIDALQFRKPSSFITNEGTPYIEGLVALPYSCGDSETHEGNGHLIAAAPRLFDTLETLVDALTTGAGRDFIEAFVRDASAALEEAQPGWNKVDEPTASEMRAKGRVRDVAPELLQAAKAVAFSNGFDAALPDKMEALRAVIAKAGGAA